MRYLFLLTFFSITFHLPTSLVAQTTFIDKLSRIFEFELHSKQRDTSHYTTKLVLAPIISYEPATNLGLGVGSKFLFKPKKAGEDTRTSNIPISLQYTLNNQVILTSSYEVFFPEERWLLKGNLGFSKFPVGFFGIGNQTQTKDKIELSYNSLLIEPLLLRNVGGKVFLGGGFRYRRSYGAKVIEPEGNFATLLDSIATTSVGLELALTIDSRNNVLNATQGNFLAFTHGFYDQVLGGSAKFMLSKFDYRKYTKIKQSDRDILAYQFYSRVAWGTAPLLEFSALGGAELLRGFQEGRFVDQMAHFTQLEYRWQTFRRIGFVFFGGAGKVMARNESFTFDDLKYSLGTGIRLKIVAKENLNVRFDYAFGFASERGNNFYLGIAESF